MVAMAARRGKSDVHAGRVRILLRSPSGIAAIRRFEILRRAWRRFRSVPAGERFQRRYHRRAGSRSRGRLRMFIAAGLGALMVLAGVLMLVLPGPGLLVIALGMALIAEESLWASRLLDRLDLWIERRFLRMRS